MHPHIFYQKGSKNKRINDIKEVFSHLWIKVRRLLGESEKKCNFSHHAGFFHRSCWWMFFVSNGFFSCNWPQNSL